MRWSLALMAYDFSIKHEAGKLIPATDALSRFPYERMVAVIDIPGQNLDVEQMKQLQAQDPELQDIIQHLQKALDGDNTPIGQEPTKTDNYFLDDHGILFHLRPDSIKKNLQISERLVVPTSLQAELMLWAHDSLDVGGHFGQNRTYHKLNNKYYWPTMREDVFHWVRTCQGCQAKKSPSTNPRAPLRPILSSGPWEHIEKNIKGPLPRTKRYQNKYILVVMDHYSKYALCFPLKTLTTVEIADILYKEIILKFGAFRVLQTDQGSDLTSKLIVEICRLFNIRKVESSSYHPISQGLVERFNATLATTLSIFTSENQDDWDELLPGVVFAYNTSTNVDSTGFSPYFLQFARQPLLPPDTRLIPPAKVIPTYREFLKTVIDNLEIARQITDENMEQARMRMKHRYDQKATKPDWNCR